MNTLMRIQSIGAKQDLFYFEDYIIDEAKG